MKASQWELLAVRSDGNDLRQPVGRPRQINTTHATSALYRPAGGHVRVPYADLGRLPVTLWEHREAVQKLNAAGRGSVNEHAIFAAITAQREVLRKAQAQSKSARRAIARQDLAGRSMPVVTPSGGGEGADSRDDEPHVPMPEPARRVGVESW